MKDQSRSRTSPRRLVSALGDLSHWPRSTATVAALFLLIQCSQGAPTPLQSILPRPADLGSNWAWPWNNPNNPAKFSEEDWRSRFWEPQDARPLLTKNWIELERTTEAEFQGQTQSLNQTLKLIGVENAPLTRSTMLKEVRAQALGITDFAYVDYDHLPAPTSTSYPSATDTLTLKLTAYTDDFIRERPSELGEIALAKALGDARETLQEARETRERRNTAQLNAHEQAVLAAYAAKRNLEEMTQSGIPKQVLTNALADLREKEADVLRTQKDADQITGRLSRVQGTTLDGIDGGYLVWAVEGASEVQSIKVTGKLRVRSVIVEFNRSAPAQTDNSVVEDTLRILMLVTGGIEDWLNVPTRADTPIRLHAAARPPVASVRQPSLDSAETNREVVQATPPTELSLPTRTVGNPIEDPTARTQELEAAGPPPPETATIEATPPIAAPPTPSPEWAISAKQMAAADQLYASNRLPEALELYKQLVAATPDDVDLQIAVGRTLNYLDDKDGAIAAYSRVHELAPDTPNVRTWLAELYLAKGDSEQAVKWIADEITDNPKSAWALSWLASTHLEGGDPVTAKSGFRQAMELDPQVASYRQQNGTVLQARKLYRRALTEFAAATYLDPSAAEPYLGVAACYSALSERAAAIKWYERYLKLDPASKWAAVARKDLERLQTEQ